MISSLFAVGQTRPILLAAAVFVLASFAGCTFPESMLRGNASVSQEINGQPLENVLEASVRVMAEHGYTLDESPNGAETAFSQRGFSPVGFMRGFLCGGRDRIWLVAQPMYGGWQLTCLPEPVGRDTSFWSPKFRKILSEIAGECGKTPPALKQPDPAGRETQNKKPN